MYTPKYHALTDMAAMRTQIAEHPLGAWVCMAQNQLMAIHIPFMLDVQHGGHGRLLGHVSRANPGWHGLVGGAPSVVMFMGPDAYITPSWYPGKREHGKVVPTWNYVTVHAQESLRDTPWKVTDAPAAYIDQMLRVEVGIEITIERLEGRLKVSQDEDEKDRLGTVEGLRGMSHAPAQILSDLVLRELRQSEGGFRER